MNFKHGDAQHCGTTSNRQGQGTTSCTQYLTKEMCTPSPRCLPEHSKHIKVP